ncbi:Casein kinase I-like protein [Smittium mucronatum]|uniref:non-specific serine/threonine protein kinase n=1 Tax=Smittium mucronatum TaxID=133383 RepID=A0A1R0H7I0_9FUNG|nr:Casein kinase I-like protein [Smittium mucronatum]
MQHTSPNVVGVHYRVGTNLLTNTPVAIKFEPRKTEAPQLRDEYRTYKILSGVDGIPAVYYFGLEGLYSVLCIDLLGPSLEDMFDLCKRKFSVKTTAMIAKQMITRIQAVHEHNLIYRDIKPDNFLMGKQNSNNRGKVYLVDFGMAKLYRDPKTHIHVPYRERKSLSGTARYMSINTHLGREQSRRDDLESIGHVIMYFLRGSLPWQGLKAANNKQKYEKIGQKKQYTSVKELCEDYPEEFGIYLTTVRKYSFEETPDYDYLRGLLDAAIKRVGETDDGVYDWMVPSNGYGSESSMQNTFSGRESRNGLTPNGKEKNLHSSNQALVSFQNKTSRTQTGNQPDLDSNPNVNANSREQISNDGVNSSNPRLSNRMSTPLNRSQQQFTNSDPKNARNDQYSQPTNANPNAGENPREQAQSKGFLAKLFSCGCFS